MSLGNKTTKALWHQPGAIKAERKGVRVGKEDLAGGVAERGEGKPVGEVGGTFNNVVEAGVAAQSEAETAVAHVRRNQERGIDDGEGRHTAGGRAKSVRDYDVVT